MFLSDTELEQFTGRKRAKAQIAWLIDNGCRFRVNAAGRPVVREHDVDELFGAPRHERKGRPRFDLINGRRE